MVSDYVSVQFSSVHHSHAECLEFEFQRVGCYVVLNVAQRAPPRLPAKTHETLQARAAQNEPCAAQGHVHVPREGLECG